MLLHVPKCGGTSVGDALASVAMLEYSQVNAIAYHRGHGDVRKYYEQPWDALCDYGVIGGHIPYSYVSHLPRVWKRVLWVREPIKRLVSEVRHVRRVKPPYVEGICPATMTVADMVKRDRPTLHEQVNALTMTMGWNYCYADDKDFRRMEGEALRRLEDMDFIGSLDHMEQSVYAFGMRFGQRIEIGHENASPRRTGSDDREDSAQPLADDCMGEINVPQLQFALRHDYRVWRKALELGGFDAGAVR
jgi:hypothetical protein